MHNIHMSYICIYQIYLNMYITCIYTYTYIHMYVDMCFLSASGCYSRSSIDLCIQGHAKPEGNCATSVEGWKEEIRRLSV